MCLSLLKRPNCCVTQRCGLSMWHQSDFCLPLNMIHKTYSRIKKHSQKQTFSAALSVVGLKASSALKVLPCQSRCGKESHPAVPPGGLGSASPALESWIRERFAHLKQLMLMLHCLKWTSLVRRQKGHWYLIKTLSWNMGHIHVYTVHSEVWLQFSSEFLFPSKVSSVASFTRSLRHFSLLNTSKGY